MELNQSARTENSLLDVSANSGTPRAGKKGKKKKKKKPAKKQETEQEAE